MTPASLLKFLNAARNLAKQGLKEKDILAFAKQEFGEVTDLVRLQINKIFKTKNQPSVGIKTKDPVFDNTVETIPFDDTGTPFNSRNPQKVYGKPREGIKTLDEAEMDIKSIDDATNELNDAVTEADAFSESIGFPAATKKIKNEPLDPDDVLPNYNETPGEFARRNTSGSKENLLEQMKAAYPQRYNNLTGNETAAELKGIMEKANKTDVPFSTGAGATKKIKNRDMTPNEYDDFVEEVGGADQLEAYNFDGTVGDAKRILKEQESRMKYMYDQYRTGKLDPVAGDKSLARKRFLEKKLEEMEMSGDKKLMTFDEIEELATFDLGTDMDKAVKKFKDKTLENSIKLNNFDPKGRKPSAKGGRIKMAKGGLPNILGF